MTQEKKDFIIEKINTSEKLLLIVKGKKYPSRLLGRRLDFPYVHSITEMGLVIEVEISWNLAERLAQRIEKGEVPIVEY